LHIAITTLWFPHDKNPLYGIFIHTQAQALAKHAEVTVLVTRRKLIPYHKKYKVGKVNVVERGGPYLPNTSESRLDNWSKYYEKMFDEVNKEKKIDLIHCHDYIALYPTRKINKKNNIPYIVTIHNTDFLRGTVGDWRSSYISDAFLNSEKVIAVGETLKQKLYDYTHEDQIVNIPNIVDTELFSYHTPAPTPPFKFLYVGIYEERKRVMQMIKAFHKLDRENSQLTFIGYGSLEKQMKSYINKHNLQNRVHVIAPKSNDELPMYYQSHHCYISISTWETFGITVAEAMSCGLHILYSRSGGPEHFVAPEGCMLVEDVTPSALAMQMQEMISNYDPKKSVHIRNHVEQNLSSEYVIDKLLEIYSKIIKN
jgi:glycosyltransferase involved in cell wall biosynthesis